MESSGLLSAAKKGLMSKLERFTGIYGGIFGWRSLKRNRLQKRLDKKEVAKEKRFARLAREFRGRLMLEPLEERIVPAVASVLVDAGEFVLFNFSSMGGDGQTYGIIANAGTDSFVVAMDASQDATPSFLDDGVDLLDSIHLYSDPAGNGNAEIFDELILTNVRVPMLDDSLVDPDDGGTGDTINATLVTGLQFGFTAQGDQVTFGGMTFTLADDPDGPGGYEYGNFTLIDGASTDPAFSLDQFGETNAHGSDVGAVNANNNGIVHLVERTSIGTANDSDPDIDGNQPWAGIDTRVAEEDGGDVGAGYVDTALPGLGNVVGNIDVSGIIGARVDGSGNLVETTDYVDYLGVTQTKPDTGYGIWAHDGSILASSTNLAFGATPTAATMGLQITAENIGILKAEWDIGDGGRAVDLSGLVQQTITAGDGADASYLADTLDNTTGLAGADGITDFVPDGISEQIAEISAGRHMLVDYVNADDGIGNIIAGLGDNDGSIVVDTIDGNADARTTPEDMGINLIRAINGDIQAQEITTADDGLNDDRFTDNNVVVANRIADPYGYDLPQNRPTDIRMVEALGPDTDPNGPTASIFIAGGGGLFYSDADLGWIVSGLSDGPFTNPFAQHPNYPGGGLGGRVRIDSVVIEGSSGPIIGPGGVRVDMDVWRAATIASGPDDTWGTGDDILTPYLLNIWSGRDTPANLGDLSVDTGIIYRVEAYDADGNAADDVTAAISFNTAHTDIVPPNEAFPNPIVTIMDLKTAAYGDGTDVTDLFDDNTVVDAQTDFKITTRQIVTETFPATVVDNASLIAFTQDVSSDDLADSPALVDLLGIDVDGPYDGSGVPDRGGAGQTDLRNVLLEANLGMPIARPAMDYIGPLPAIEGIIDLDVSLPTPNEPDDIGDVAYPCSS